MMWPFKKRDKDNIPAFIQDGCSPINPNYSIVYSFMKDMGQPVTMDELMENLGMSWAEVSDVLDALKNESYVRSWLDAQDGPYGKRYYALRKGA